MNANSDKTATTRPVGKRDRNIRRRRIAAQQTAAQPPEAADERRWPTLVAILAVLAVGALFLIYQNARSNQDTAADGGSGYRHVAGNPGIGAPAPDFTLTSHTGDTVSLSDYRGRSVLLYFQEGLMCKPCWDQITDLENNQAALKAAGIDAVVSISHDPVAQQARKAADQKVSTPMLADPTQQVIHAYDAHKYGMMREQTAGHSFVLVGPDGTISWRADYGGAPNYTMFVPTNKLLADLATERKP
ncbi:MULTISPECIES: peroxiredoxin family protein [Nocardia]|uniref:peroxiredoxin family protein n=1 Tax=Nocardia TaxID=1817 RepID=UPI0002E3683F|nr:MULTISPECIES: peroxiredoxin family protein [Nocardia]